jgi:hypothetical protein
MVQLVHEMVCSFDGHDYVIEVYSRPDGSHYARTTFSAKDVIISDGFSLEEALSKHQDLLPLAINLRKIPSPLRLSN